MSQNRSTAVMQRRVEAHDSLDHFPTPPWATRALCEWLMKASYALPEYNVLEPACAEGYMARALGEYFTRVDASDVHDYGYGDVVDFLWPSDARHDWVITNPPFRLACEFALTARRRARFGVALLVRSAFLEGVGRHAELFNESPPSEVLQFCERVPMVKGRIDKKATTATAYCWLVWRIAQPPITRLHWIAPCRRRLERELDYH